MAPSIARYKAAIKTELRWFTTTAAMIGREDREDALLKSALQVVERVRVVSEHLTECLMLLEETHNPEDQELVEADVSQCLELAQDIEQAAADITRRRDGQGKPFRGKVGQGLQVPLPPVTVPVFAGDYADWPAFEDLYSSVVHTRTDITPAYKMAQLMSRLQGEPHELLTHLAVSDSNYEVAWKILTDRYRNKRLIVDRLLDQWLSIPTITRGTDLREKIFHPVSVAVSALERQGLPVAGYGYILVHTVLRRLPSEMVARFEQLHGGKSSDHLPTYEDLKSFLEAESRRVDVQAGEAPRKETSAPRHPERPGAPARGGNSGQPRRYNTALESGCAYCRETGHRVTACQEFAAQRVQRRRGVAQQRRWCYRCLGPHQVRECPSSTNCRYCQGAHHPLLCMNRSGDAGGSAGSGQRRSLPTKEEQCSHPPRRSPPPHRSQGQAGGRQQTEPTSQRTWGRSPPRQQVPDWGRTAQEHGQGHPSQVRDSTGGCQESTRQPPGYMQYSTGLSHLVGPQDPRMPPPMTEYPRLQAQPRYQVSAVVLDEVVGKLPQVRLPPTVRGLTTGLELADPDFDTPGTVDVLLGSDVLGRLWCGRKKVLQEAGLVAVDTTGGYVVFGPVWRPQDLPEGDTVLYGSVLSEVLQRFWESEEPPTTFSILTDIFVRVPHTGRVCVTCTSRARCDFAEFLVFRHVGRLDRQYRIQC
ncbi:hypothetical protein NE865_13353 [Phthorimaea operculella]|nr:hypothetical protein NE865_13353 [Phthorimaea operculella]